MVNVTGQLDAPLVDLGAMRQEYWERQEVKLPSLSKLHKPKGWRSWFYKEQTPVVILQRLKTEDWERINNDHYYLKKELVDEMPRIREISKKIENLEPITDKERIYMADLDTRTRPIVLAMLAEMIIEPVMKYEDVVLMFEFLDDYDSKTLLSIVNTMTAERASVAIATGRERTAELAQLRKDVGLAK